MGNSNRVRSLLPRELCCPGVLEVPGTDDGSVSGVRPGAGPFPSAEVFSPAGQDQFFLVHSAPDSVLLCCGESPTGARSADRACLAHGLRFVGLTPTGTLRAHGGRTVRCRGPGRPRLRAMSACCCPRGRGRRRGRKCRVYRTAVSLDVIRPALPGGGNGVRVVRQRPGIGVFRRGVAHCRVCSLRVPVPSRASVAVRRLSQDSWNFATPSSSSCWTTSE